ncbi:NAD(P)/FAD-dependent oxidoreductase [Halothermothrix orenii]|uniref:Glycerol-3-phosphate dehydrogenase n=1 Tax=Halothermothrix orenii (strain H 168 / OCM 544 / DSM 9562) TaxID=373903 RepID=B8CW98_HALOH|nr:NAD(P)/FAD-dependent oxidoreductase [Halothermothrix orenii]ACL69567.1 glycerol-3-phosphate dehydrogenase [Halothermothrix orenii H 168]
MRADVIIIGSGVVGSAIARRLARYNLDIILLEKEHDVAMGTSKANSGIIHAGYNAPYDSLKGRLNVKSNPEFDKLCRDLRVPFKRIGSLVVGFDDKDLKILKEEKENGEKAGIKDLEIVKGKRLFEIEPNLNPEAMYALYAPTAGIISPHQFTIALADSAALNGVKVMLLTEARNIKTENGMITGVETNRGFIAAKVVINAAGVYAGNIASLAGDSSISITPRKGEYHLLDKEWGDKVNHVLFPIPSTVSKGILVTPTVHGNLLIGPNSYNVEDPEDVSTTTSGLDEVYNGARRLVPSINRRDVIASFAGLRAAASGEDFIIGSSSHIKGLIHAAGIQSPGLSSAPAIAEKVEEIFKDIADEFSLEISYKDDFKETLPEYPCFSEKLEKSHEQEWNNLVRENPDFGEIVCRCERVTKGEIIAAIHRPVPALSLDAIKRRTRAGMGRCQGGFCGHRVLEILSEELNISPLEVTKKGGESKILMRKTKDTEHQYEQMEVGVGENV